MTSHSRCAVPRVAVIAVAVAALLAACAPSVASPSATPRPSPPATASALATPTPTVAAAAPLVVTWRQAGPQITPWAAAQLSLVGEDGSFAGTVLDPGGIDGDAYTVGSDHIYFIDGTGVKAMARDGTITDVGQVPQAPTTVTATNQGLYTALAVSPDESTLVFGIPIAIQGDNGATTDHSQLWTEPVGGTAASATMVYDDVSSDGSVLLPFAWSDSTIWVSRMPTSGLGGAGPFLDYSHIDPATFDPTSHVLAPVSGDCFFSDARAIDLSSTDEVCQTPGSPTLTVQLASGSKTVTMQPSDATGFGGIRVSDDGRYLAYGAYIGDFGSGHYVSTVIDLSSAATVATLQGYTPEEWLADNRLLVSQSYIGGASYLLSPAFAAPAKIGPDQPVDALP